MMYMSDETLNALTVASPTSEEFLLRSKFWRKFAASIDVIDDKTNATYNLIVANCSDMDARAYAVASGIVEPVAAAPVVQAKPARKGSSLTAEQFWTMQAAAVQAIRAEHGDRWYLIGETVTGSLPAKLRSMIGPLGGKITWRRDHRFPAARYWPGGAIPADVALAPVWVPSADFYAAEPEIIVRTREAQQEQITVDRALMFDRRVETLLATYWRQLARLDDAIDGMVRHTVIKSVNAAADSVIGAFISNDPAEEVEQESRDDMDAEQANEIQAEAERESEYQAMRAREAEEAETARLVRQAEADDRTAAERAEWPRIDAEVADAKRIEADRAEYAAWWIAALDKAEVDAMIEASAVRNNRQAELARLARGKLAAELEAQELTRKAAEHAERKAAWNAAQAARVERVARETIAAVHNGRQKGPAPGSAFNAGRAAFLASLQDAAD